MVASRHKNFFLAPSRTPWEMNLNSIPIGISLFEFCTQKARSDSLKWLSKWTLSLSTHLFGWPTSVYWLGLLSAQLGVVTNDKIFVIMCSIFTLSVFVETKTLRFGFIVGKCGGAHLSSNVEYMDGISDFEYTCATAAVIIKLKCKHIWSNCRSKNAMKIHFNFY